MIHLISNSTLRRTTTHLTKSNLRSSFNRIPIQPQLYYRNSSNIPIPKVSTHDIHNTILASTQETVSSYQHFISYYDLMSGDLTWYAYPSTAVEFLLEGLQFYTGIPWWAVLFAVAGFMRFITFPFQVIQTRKSAEIQELQSVLKKDVSKQMLLKGSSLSNMFQVNEVYKKHGKSPFGALKYALFQIPIFILTFIAIREMCLSSKWVQELSSGGFLWIKNLTIADPFFILPIISGIVVFLAVYTQVTMSLTQPGIFQMYLPYVAGFLVALVTVNLPAGVGIYILGSSIFGVLTSLFLKREGVRAYFKIPKLKKEPFKVAADIPKNNQQAQPITKIIDAKQELLKKKR